MILSHLFFSSIYIIFGIVIILIISKALTWSVNEAGVLLEILGFVLFIPKIENSLKEWHLINRMDYKNFNKKFEGNYITTSISIIRIIFILFGLTLQLSIVENYFW